MSVETWLAPTPRFDDPIVADSAALQVALEAQLTLAGWSNPSPNVWKSADPAHWIQVTISQPSSAKLAFVGLDYQGRAYLERRVGTVTASSQWDIYANPYGFTISGPTDGKWFHCGVIDHFPKPITSHVLDVVWGGGFVAGDTTAPDYYQLMLGPRYDGAVGAYMGGAYYAIEHTGVTGVSNYAGGPRRDAPWLVWAYSAASTRKLAGRVFHAILVNAGLSAGAEVIGVIDEGETATFRVTRIATNGSYTGFKVAMLKAKS